VRVWPGAASPLGASFDGVGTNRSVFSDVAERIELCLFSDDGSEDRYYLDYTGTGNTLNMRSAVGRVERALPRLHPRPLGRRIAHPGRVRVSHHRLQRPHTGRAIRAIPPAFSTERVAAAVIRSVRRPRRQRTTGFTGALIVIGLHVLPRFTETVVAQVAARLIFQSTPAPDTKGALDSTNVPSQTSGGWRRNRLRVQVGDTLGQRLARRH